jgi:hypothetical protein
MLYLPRAKNSEQAYLPIWQHAGPSGHPNHPFWLGCGPYIGHRAAVSQSPFAAIFASSMLYAKFLDRFHSSPRLFHKLRVTCTLGKRKRNN